MFLPYPQSFTLSLGTSVLATHILSQYQPYHLTYKPSSYSSPICTKSWNFYHLLQLHTDLFFVCHLNYCSPHHSRSFHRPLPLHYVSQPQAFPIFTCLRQMRDTQLDPVVVYITSIGHCCNSQNSNRTLLLFTADYGTPIGLH